MLPTKCSIRHSIKCQKWIGKVYYIYNIMTKGIPQSTEPQVEYVYIWHKLILC